ncbi:MAG: hypothetical protein JJU21_17325 [Salinarimonas sp.]|nr:hypothetical protein [Salinarimonas sp.]
MTDLQTFRSVSYQGPGGASGDSSTASTEFNETMAMVEQGNSRVANGAGTRHDVDEARQEGFVLGYEMAMRELSGRNPNAMSGGQHSERAPLIPQQGYAPQTAPGGSDFAFGDLPASDSVARYFSGMDYPGTGSVGIDSSATNPFSMPGAGLSSTDPLTGAMNWIKQMTQLLTVFAQLEQIAGQIARGSQHSDMTSQGSGTYPGAPQHGNPEMSIMPVGDHQENVQDRGSPTMVGGPDGDDLLRSGSERNGALNLTAEERELNQRINSGEGEVALNTAALSDSAVAEIYTGGSMYEVLDYAMRDPAAMREQVFGALSGLDAPDNVTTALNELFDLLDAGDEQAFINAFLNLSRTHLAEFLVPAAIDVANAVRREEEGDPEVEPLPESRDDIGEPTIMTEYPDDDDGEREAVLVLDPADIPEGISLEDFMNADRNEVIAMLDGQRAESNSVENDADDTVEDEAA